MIDYLKLSVIYIIKCKDDKITNSYIGSTDNMKSREQEHRSKGKSKKRTGKLYLFVKDNGGWDNFEFFLLEKYEAISKDDLRNREGYWINKIKPTLNTQRASGLFINRDSYYCTICDHDYETQSRYGFHLKNHSKHK